MYIYIYVGPLTTSSSTWLVSLDSEKLYTVNLTRYGIGQQHRMAKPTDTPMSVPPLKWAKHQPMEFIHQDLLQLPSWGFG